MHKIPAQNAFLRTGNTNFCGFPYQKDTLVASGRPFYCRQREKRDRRGMPGGPDDKKRKSNVWVYGGGGGWLQPENGTRMGNGTRMDTDEYDGR